MIKQTILPALTILLIGCGQSNQTNSNTAAADSASTALFIDTTRLHTMGIELGHPVRVGVTPRIFATGKIISLPNNEATVSSCIDGRVEQVYVLPGETVTAGQSLLRISTK